jgi:hypothetical protein
MKITQVTCKGIILSIGDKIEVNYKEILDNGEEGTDVTKEIAILGFAPLDDGSGNIWIVDKDGEVYADENFKSKCD